MFRAALAAFLAAAPVAALAAPVDYTVRVEVGSGPLAGQSYRFGFTIDDVFLATDGSYDDFEAGLGIDAIDVAFGGSVFTRDNADAIFLAVEGGRLVDFVLGGAPSGFDLISSGDAAADFDLSPFGFGYKLEGPDEFIFQGDVFFARVPEPALLLLPGLALLAAVRRQRAASSR